METNKMRATTTYYTIDLPLTLLKKTALFPFVVAGWLIIYVLRGVLTAVFLPIIWAFTSTTGMIVVAGSVALGVVLLLKSFSILTIVAVAMVIVWIMYKLDG